MSLPEPICKIEMWSFVCNDESHQHYLWIWKTPFLYWIDAFCQRSNIHSHESCGTSVGWKIFVFSWIKILPWLGVGARIFCSILQLPVFGLPFHENAMARIFRMITTQIHGMASSALFFSQSQRLWLTNAPHVPLVWLILSCPVMLLVGVMMMLFRHWKMLMLIIAKQNFRFV